ncbi:MAG TPA: arginine--tRNA ligase, partial [Patescibacteria group bacterium]|nr:arginine--tRNA ligase [Patescibacteria group bacterium]
MTLKDTLKKQINQILSRKYSLLGFDFNIDYPPTSELGDYATNVAMALGQKFKKNPLDIAGELAQELATHKMWAKVSVARPGFIN